MLPFCLSLGLSRREDRDITLYVLPVARNLQSCFLRITKIVLCASHATAPWLLCGLSRTSVLFFRGFFGACLPALLAATSRHSMCRLLRTKGLFLRTELPAYSVL